MLRVKIKFTDGSKCHLEVRPWCTVKDVKDQLCVQENIPTDCQRIFSRGVELANTWPLTLAEDRAALFCVVSSSRGGGGSSGRASLEIRGTSSDCAPVLRRAIRDAKRGLQLNLKPILADDGSGGTYFLRGAGKQYVAVFKPRDEEPGAAHNPRGYVGEHGQIAANRGIFAGQACDRELAAYLLDHAGLAGVPPTALAEAVHPSFHHGGGGGGVGGMHHDHQQHRGQVKVGILQQFVQSDDVAGNLASSLFSVHDVQSIALFDMRLLNTDRNDSNILVRRRRPQQHDPEAHGAAAGTRQDSAWSLVPIDHGYCLPQTLNIGWCDWCWLSWKQIQQPLSPELVDYIASLDADKDAFRLQRETSITRLALRNMRIVLMLLKTGAAAGLTLAEIASLMVRHDVDLEVPSELEIAVSRAGALAESMVRSPRMRGSSLSSSPNSPSRKTRTPSPSLSPSSIASLGARASAAARAQAGSSSAFGKVPASPMQKQSLGAPAIAVSDLSMPGRTSHTDNALLEQAGGADSGVQRELMRLEKYRPGSAVSSRCGGANGAAVAGTVAAAAAAAAAKTEVNNSGQGRKVDAVSVEAGSTAKIQQARPEFKEAKGGGEEAVMPMRLARKSIRRLSDRLLELDTHQNQGAKGVESAATTATGSPVSNPGGLRLSKSDLATSVDGPHAGSTPTADGDCKNSSPRGNAISVVNMASSSASSSSSSPSVPEAAAPETAAPPPSSAATAAPIRQFELCLPSLLSVIKGDLDVEGSGSGGIARQRHTISAAATASVPGTAVINPRKPVQEKSSWEKSIPVPPTVTSAVPIASPERRAERRARRVSRSSKISPPVETDDFAAHPDCVCSDDERFLRSPRRRFGDNMDSPRRSGSPQQRAGSPSPGRSTPPSPALERAMSPTSLVFPRRAASGPKTLSRTMSFLDVRGSGAGSLSGSDDVPRRVLRMASVSSAQVSQSAQKQKGGGGGCGGGSGNGSGGGGLSKLSTGGGGGATSTLDRVFFSYMGKLFADLVDLKLRARRRVSGKDAGTGAVSVQSAQEVSTSSGSDSSGHGDSGDGEAEEAGGFYIGE